MDYRILAVDDELHILKLLERVITEKTPYHIPYYDYQQLVGDT